MAPQNAPFVKCFYAAFALRVVGDRLNVCLRAAMPLVENVMPNTFPAKELDDPRTPV